VKKKERVKSRRAVSFALPFLLLSSTMEGTLPDKCGFFKLRTSCSQCSKREQFLHKQQLFESRQKRHQDRVLRLGSSQSHKQRRGDLSGCVVVGSDGGGGGGIGLFLFLFRMERNSLCFGRC